MTPTPELPDLTLLRRIGSGNYGDVWLARTVTGIYRAVKIVDRSRFVDERPFLRELNGITQFQRQAGNRARLLALMHVGYDEKAGVLYYVMELADDVRTGTDIDPGTYAPLTLRTLQEQQPEMPAAEAIRLGVEIARSLVELHAAGLIHRDIKISNIIFVAGVPKLADIGLVSASDHSLTVLGTPGYTPAEGAVTASADLYGLGKILYVLTTGQAATAFPRLPTDVSRRPDGVLLAELDEVIQRACAPDPRQRYQTAAQMLDDLLVLQAGRSLKELQRTRERLVVLRRFAIAAVGVAFVVIALLGLFNHLALRRSAENESAARLRAEQQERLAHYTADLHRALVNLLNRDIGLVRSALRRQIPAADATDMRGLEWNALWNEAAGDDHAVLGSIDLPPIRNAVLSPDGRWLATRLVQGAGRIALWDLSARSRRLLEPEWTHLVGFAPDSGRLTLADRDGVAFRLRLDDSADGVSIGPIVGTIVRPSLGNGPYIIGQRIESNAWSLSLRDPRTHLEFASWSPEPDLLGHRLASAVASDSGELLAVCLYEHENTVPNYHLQIWRHDGSWTRLVHRKVAYQLAMAFSHDSTRLAFGGPSDVLEIVPVADGQPARTFPGHTGTVFDLAFSPDDRWLASAGEDQTIRIWDTLGEIDPAVLRGHEGSVSALAWHPSGEVVSAGSDGTVRLWHPHRRPKVRARDGFWDGFLGDFLYAPDGSTLVVSDASGRITELDTTRLEPTGRSWDALHPVSLSSRELLALDSTLELVRADLAGGALRSTSLRADPARRVVITAASPESRYILVACSDGLLEIWDSFEERVVTSSDLHRAAVFSAAFAPDGSFAVTGDLEGVLWIWEPTNGRALRSIRDSASPAFCLDVSPEGHIAVGREDGSLTVFAAEDGSRLASTFAHTRALTALAYAKDGSRLFTTGYDGVVAVWTVPRLREVATLPIPTLDETGGPDPRPGLLRVAPGSDRMAIFTEGGWLRTWDFRRSTP
jgi:WD40 repeat protein